MKIEDAATIAVDTTRNVLEDMVRTSKGGWNFGTMMTCYRGLDPVAMVTLPPTRNALLQAAFFAARGFGPDTLALTHDTFVVGVPGPDAKDPRTGKRWAPNRSDGPGPMQTYVDEFGYDGTVLDCLMTHVVNRAGDSKLVPRPYAVEGKSVKWLDLVADESQYGDDGVGDKLRQYMQMSTLDQMTAGGPLPLWAKKMAAQDPERARWAYDMVTTKFFEAELDSVAVALFATNGSPRAQMLRSHFPRAQVIDPRKGR